MKLNDIFTNLKEKINLKNSQVVLGIVNKLENAKNVDTIRKGLNKIKLKKNKQINLSKLENNIEPFGNYKDINLKKIIKQKGLFYKIIGLFSNGTKQKKYNRNKKIIQNNSKFYINKKYKIFAYLLIFFSIILVDKIIIENLTISAIKNLYNLKYSQNFEQIETNLSRAKTKLNFANIFFTPFKIIPNTQIQNAKNAIYLLQDSSQIGLDFIDYYKENLKFLKTKKISEIYFTNLLENSIPFWKNEEKKLEKIRKNLEKIKLKTSNSYYKKLENLKLNLDLAYNFLNTINKNFETFLEILGKNKIKTYLIVFQNNDEIRSTGGFMGSAGIVKILDGKILNFEKRDIYDLEWQAKKNYPEQVKGPSGVNLLSKRLGLRDSNAFVNFETSAKSINYFMKKANYNLDGIVFVNQKIVLDILKEIGEIDFSKYDSKVTYKNFSKIISMLVEAKVSKNATLDTPKQVLFDFSELLIQKIKQNHLYSEVLKAIFKNLNSRDIVFISFNPKEQNLLRKLNLDGNFNYNKQDDFNYPFFISVGGNKTDRYIKRTYSKTNKIIPYKNKCKIYSKFEIKLENTFNKKELENIKNLAKKFRIKANTDLLNIMGAGINKSYTKVIIPEKAVIDNKYLKKFGYKIIDFGKFKTIEKLLKTKSGEKSYFTFDYYIYNTSCETPRIAIYKQAGIYNYNLKFSYTNEKNGDYKEYEIKNLTEDFKFNN